MVLTCTRRTSNNKENSVGKTPLLPGKCSTKTHRKRTRFYRTCLVPSRVQREAARRANCSTGTIPDVTAGRLFTQAESVDESAGIASSPKAMAQRKISLPRQLQRPAFRPISPTSIAAIDPDLSEIPIDYIRQKLQAVGEQMYTNATRISAKCPKGRLPRELEVVINDMSSQIPTHVFAIYSVQESALQKQRVVLHPVHALVLASQCAHLPPLPQSTPSLNASTVTLPILPLRLPSPRTFTLLLAYLYTHRIDDLLSALLPVPPNELSAQKLAETCTVPALLSFTHTLHGLWSNVAALGVFDDALWRAMDQVWTSLLDALAVKTRES